MATTRSYAGRSGPARVAERRARLIAATIDLVSDHGPARTTMTAICQRAGLTERYFYESFAGVDAALTAALEDVGAEILDRASAALASSDGGAAGRVRAVLADLVAWVEEEPRRAAVAVLHAPAHPAMRSRRQQLLQVFADFAAGEAADLFGDAAWPAQRARMHALVFVGGLSELIAAWLLGDLDATPEEMVATAGEVFVAVHRRRDSDASPR